MSYKIEYKISPGSHWASGGVYSTEAGAIYRASNMKSARPGILVRVVDLKTGSVVMSL